MFNRGLRYNEKYHFEDEDMYNAIREGVNDIWSEEPERVAKGELGMRDVAEVLESTVADWTRRTIVMPIDHMKETEGGKGILGMVNIETARYGIWEAREESEYNEIVLQEFGRQIAVIKGRPIDSWIKEEQRGMRIETDMVRTAALIGKYYLHETGMLPQEGEFQISDMR